MWIAITIISAVLLIAIVYLACLNGHYCVERNLEIDAPIKTVFAAIVDFKSWPRWSPWLMHEPNAKLDYSENFQQESGFYSWDGKVVGAGKMMHVSINPYQGIQQQIEFLRPFKSTNQVHWSFEDLGDSTRVSWQMVGSMPFLFRFMVKKLEPMIGRDYELGLALLSGYLNPASPHPTFEFVGEEALENFGYWSIPCQGPLSQLESSRQTTIDTLQAAANGKTGLAFTLYHRFDPMATQFHAEIAVPVGENPPKSNFIRREFQAGRYFHMTLCGDHRFLPMAWYALCSHCRMHKIKVDQRRPALEIYHDVACQMEPSTPLKTALYLPIK